ncbi:MAG: class I SAM-dependent methyltransferase [Actinocatenispora sp.]
MDWNREQREYYDHRAGEYDEWWLRQGRYELPPDLSSRWRDDVAQAESALDTFAPTGQVLELAPGTGLWTRHLVRYAEHVTAVDASAAMIARNRDRLAGQPVSYLEADLFSWQPTGSEFDVVFFGYWLSHVPRDRFADFWSLVDRALRPGGRVFFVDSGTLPGAEVDPAGTEHRTLNDGRSFRVVKSYWQPPALRRAVRDFGWDLRAEFSTNGMILFGQATRREPGPGA